MVLTFLDVSGRKFLSHSITGSLELTELLMVVVIFGALPLVSRKGEHAHTGYNKTFGGHHGRSTEYDYIEEKEQDNVKY